MKTIRVVAAIMIEQGKVFVRANNQLKAKKKVKSS